MYSADITRNQPTAFCLLIDMSGSMQQQVEFASGVATKAEAVTHVANTIITELIDRCRRDDGIRDYFDIAVLGYGDGKVDSLLPEGAPFAKPSVLCLRKPIQLVRRREITMPDGNIATSVHNEKQWVCSGANGDTPMYAGFMRALSIIEQWCCEHRNSYPLTLLHITDGEASDASEHMLLDITDKIKSTSTSDGNTLLINIDVSAGECTELMFPDARERLPVLRYARVLYEMSSIMPELYNARIVEIKGEHAVPPFRGMGFNATIVDLLSMMSIGSVSANIL